MQFTTKVPIPKSNNLIDYDSKIVSLGSCFAVNIADKLNYFKFQNFVNPFGILFHPLAIQEVIQRALQQQFYTKDEVFFHNERWHCFDVHSDLNAAHQQNLLQNLNRNLIDFNSNIKSASHILITYGTAWVYKEKSTQKVVANCHKLPQHQFEKELLDAIKIQTAIEETIALIRNFNPKARIVFTVSPVRHLKDGFIENQRSKSNLITAIHQTIDTQTFNFQSSYFPAYEIMIDELRDYRFYADDMMHPNATAIQYIWEQFVSSSIAPDCFPIMEQVESIQKALAHKPFHENSESHLKFKNQLAVKIAALQQLFHQIRF